VLEKESHFPGSVSPHRRKANEVGGVEGVPTGETGPVAPAMWTGATRQFETQFATANLVGKPCVGNED